MQSKEEFWQVADLLSEMTPVVIRCDSDAWKTYFDDYTMIDAVSISKSELLGTDYIKRTFFKPVWLKDSERTNTLVLIRFDCLPVNSDDPTEKSQTDFVHLIRTKDEHESLRELNFGSGIFVPRKLRVFIILPYNYALDPFFTRGALN